MVGYIKLFPEDSISFTTNGLGGLNDCLSCSVEEERNGIYELTMTYPVTGRRYSDLENRRIIFCKANPLPDDIATDYSPYQAFRIYSISKPINGIVEINARHVSYDLTGYPMAPFTEVEVAGVKHKVVQTIHDMFSDDSIFLNAEYSPKAADLPFTFDTDKDNETGMMMEKPYPIRTIMGGVKGSALDTWGGEYLYNNFKVKLCQNRGSDNGVTIRYGKNITDFKQEENCAETYTAVYPYWFTDEVDEEGEGGQEKEDIPPKIVQLENKIVEITSIPEYEDYIYGHTKVLVLDTSEHFNERPTEEQLLNYTIQYIKDNNLGEPKVSIDVSFITLERTGEYEMIEALERVKLCDIVQIYFPKMNIRAKAKCIKTKYDVLKGRYESISLGTPKMEVADTIAEAVTTIKENMTETRSNYESAFVRAANIMSGHTGGYVILNPATNPREILISKGLDYLHSPLWKFSMGGLAYYPEGYSGPVRNIAITMDGAIVADSITVGQLDGTRIKANSIEGGSLSAEYKKNVSNEIGAAASDLRYQFSTADGELMSLIEQRSTESKASYDEVKVQQSILKQSIDSLELGFKTQTSGGTNRITNSVGLNGNTPEWTINGEVYPVYPDDDSSLEDTASGSEWCMNFGDMSQIVSVTKGKNYILSFKFKSKTTMPSTVLLYNGTETNIALLTGIADYATNNTYNTGDLVNHESKIFRALEDGITGEWNETKWEDLNVVETSNGSPDNWTDVNMAFTANAKTVEFLARTEGIGFYISDLIIIEGNIVRGWQPAKDEIYGQKVKIDGRGIRIDQINEDGETTHTVIDNDEFSVINANGEKVLSVNPNYTWLLRTEIKHELDVGKLRIMPTETGAELMIMDQEVE